MGSAVLVSRKLHHHVIRHACAYAYPCRRNLLTSVNEREKGPDLEREVSLSLNEREREREREREGKREPADSYLVLSYCPSPYSSYRFTIGIDGLMSVAPVTGCCIFLMELNLIFLIDLRKGGKILFGCHRQINLKYLLCPRCHAFPTHPRSISGQEYKVVRLVRHYFGDPDRHQQPHMQAELYSLKTDSWKEILEVPLYPTSSSYCTRVHVNGRYYWRILSCNPKVEISSFDFTTEKFSLIAVPPEAGANWHCCQLVEVDGKLGCFMYCSSKEGEMQSVELWVLEEADSWARWDFEIHDVAGARDPIMYDSDAGGLLFIRGVDMGLMVYDIRTRKLDKLTITDQRLRYVVGPVSVSPPWISS